MNRRGTDRQTGMTLVELLVALAIFGLLAMMMSGGLRLGVRAWETTNLVLEDSTRLRKVQAFMRTTLINGFPARRPSKSRRSTTRNDPRRTKLIEFSGRGDSLDLVAELPVHLSGGGLSLVTFSQTVKDGNNALIVSWRPWEPGVGSGDPVHDARTATLLDDVERLSFSYLIDEQSTGSNAKSAGELEMIWAETAADLNQLPRLVRIGIGIAGAGGGEDTRSWPELIVKIPARVPGRLR